MKKIDLTGQRYGRLKVIKESEKVNNRIAWLCKCECGKEITVAAIYLRKGETRSCGCLKRDKEEENLRDQYDNKRVAGVVMPLFKDQEPRKDSSTGYRGVNKYYTRKSKELRFRAWITVKGKKYYKAGFKTAEDAYYNGRLALEIEHLPSLAKTEDKDNETNR